MDNVIQKFYSNGKEGSQKYSKLGIFSANMISSNKLNLSSSNPLQKSAEIKPEFNTINPYIYTNKNNNYYNNNNYNNYNNYKNLTSQKNLKMSHDEYLYPKKLIFNSSSDMLYHNPFKYSSKGELSLIKENLLNENKKNNIKMQMIEEKMKNLELKNQKLELLNNFFFDLFEENLAKEEIRRQKEEEEYKNLNEDSDSSDLENDYFLKRKKKLKKLYKNKSEINLNDYNNYKNMQFDALSFQQKTSLNARNILNNIKKKIGNYLVEEEFKKNEQFLNITEGINELKSDLNYKLERMQKNQKQQIQNIANFLLNSENGKIGGLPMNLFNNNFSDINKINTRYRNTSFPYKEGNINNNIETGMNINSNSGKDSFGDNFITIGRNHRNSLKRSQSQISMNRQPNNLFIREENIIPEENYYDEKVEKFYNGIKNNKWKGK